MEDKQRDHVVPVPIEKVCVFLKNNVRHIATVKQWAEVTGRTRTYFTRLFKNYYGISPCKKMASIRKKKLEELLIANSVSPAEILAEELGLSNANSLCKYISRHYETTLSTLRKRAQIQRWQTIQ